MTENTTKKYLIDIVHTMGFIEKTVPRTPQENGVSERMNRIIMERARSMRLHVVFPLQFWEDVVYTVV